MLGDTQLQLAPAAALAAPSPRLRPEAAQPQVTTRALHGIGWSSLQNLATNGISFLTYAFLARLLPPADFGLLAFASIFLVLLNLFVEQGIPDAVVQRRSLSPKHLSAAFWCNLAASLGLAGLLCVSAPLIASLVREPKLAPLLRGMSPILVLGALGGVQQAVLKRNLQYKTLAAQNLGANLAGGAVAILLALRGFGVWSLVGQQLASNAAAAAGLWAFGKWRPGFSFSTREVRDLGHFSLHVTGSAFLDFFNRRADDFLIGMFLGTAALGYYNLAYKLLLTFTRLVNSPFNSVAFSAFARLQDEPEELQKLFRRLTGLTAAIAFPVFLCMAATAPDFVRVVFGAKWIDAAPVLSILCFIGVLHAVAFLHGTLVRAAGHAHWQMWFTFAGAVTNVVGFYFTVRHGVVWVAAWYVASAYLWLSLDLYLVRRVLRHRTRSYLRGFTRPALTGLGMAGAALLLRNALPAGLPPAWRLAAEGCAALLVLFATNPALFSTPLATLQKACRP